MSSFNDFNQTVITEFRDNGGKVGGPFANMSLLLLTTIGAKSGQPRIAPLAYTTDGDHFIIIASKAGAPTNPDWYYNLLANPSVTVEIGQERFQARAAIAEGQERERLYAQMGAQLPQFLEYQQKTSRQIPIVVLERIG
ncbi:MAG TPA: nitroreductase family deazaflavin-dependent oxidoreductase [Ktedonobacteraceae bacterium]|jgi:deazaflavin-dependent oxidoreductase (nitroreductase family)|nr:nitroreductase family deazaflavin-dependent oxidoreductase [Ktedonobacteraceae bacterium]